MDTPYCNGAESWDRSGEGTGLYLWHNTSLLCTNFETFDTKDINGKKTNIAASAKDHA